jgi:nucleoside-diphosphate-sugar epimerase
MTVTPDGLTTVNSEQKMQVTVTGAGGFLGRRLVQQLLTRGSIADRTGKLQPITKIIACDLSLGAGHSDARVERVEADVSDPNVIARIITPQTAAVFHLAAVVSVSAEEDFDLGMRIYFDGTRALLEACRRRTPGCGFLFASSAAVYGGDLPPVVEDGTALAPQTSYGMQKAVGEFLINDYSRRGFIDGRCLRLPTIVVRPGKPNKAASAFASSIIREPLEGREVVCPVPRETSVCILSPAKVVEGFLHAQTIPAGDWGYTRALPLPGTTLSVGDMLAALEQLAGPRVAGRVRFKVDSRIEKIVYGWPTRFRSEKARRLGFTPDAAMKDVIEAFIVQDLDGKFVE